MTRNFQTLTAGLLMLAAALMPSGGAAPKDSKPGSVVTACLNETGMGGYVLTDGTIDGVMISGNEDLKVSVPE